MKNKKHTVSKRPNWGRSGSSEVSPKADFKAAANASPSIAPALHKVMVTQNVARVARSFGLTVSDFGAFLRRPNNEDHIELSIREKARVGIWLFTLSMVVTMIFGLLALPVILSDDLTTGEQLNEALSGSVWSTILSLVIVGPLVEEIIFRGWLSGVWRAVLASVFGLAVIYGGSAVLDPYLSADGVIKPLVLVVGAMGILVVFSPLDDGRRIFGFDRLFPIIFYAQAVAFGTLHFQNYAASSLLIALFATLPLVACGLIWGYARVRLGLASAIILHSAYNVPPAIGSIIIMHWAT